MAESENTSSVTQANLLLVGQGHDSAVVGCGVQRLRLRRRLARAAEGAAQQTRAGAQQQLPRVRRKRHAQPPAAAPVLPDGGGRQDAVALHAGVVAACSVFCAVQACRVQVAQKVSC